MKFSANLVAPSFPNEGAFFCRFFAHVGHMKDEDGRYLHEVDYRYEDNVEFENCPYSGSRNNLLMNKTALSQMLSSWKDILGGIEFFREMYLHQNPGIELNLLRNVWKISLLPMFLPLYIVSGNQQDDLVK